MALQGSHMRFALDIQGKTQPKDLKKYIVGALYPDTRYSTRTDRELTHPKDFMSWDLAAQTDFKKGWYTHLLCDHLQAIEFEKELSHLFNYQDVSTGNDSWITLTALKVLQDLLDIKTFNVPEYLPDLTMLEYPNNEDSDRVKLFYTTILELYKDAAAIDVYSYVSGFVDVGLPEDIAQEISNRADQYSKDREITMKIAAVYKNMIEAVK